MHHKSYQRQVTYHVQRDSFHFPKARKHLHSYDGEIKNKMLNSSTLLKPALIAPNPHGSIYFKGHLFMYDFASRGT
jgi:hypothetical protein